MLNCLLVAPSKATGGFEYFMNIPNGGLCSIAGNVNKEICSVKILDLIAVRFKARSYFIEYLKNNPVDIIGFSSMLIHADEITDLAKTAKEVNSKIITVLGGYYPSISHDDIVKDPVHEYFDYLIQGEGEVSFARFIENVHAGGDFSNVPGLIYFKNGTLIHQPCEELLDLNTIQLPDRSARVLKKGFTIMNYPADVCETSRGCTYTCNFCSITQMYGRSFRLFKIERIIEDLKDAKQRGAKAIFFNDDNITLNVRHFEQLCHAIIAEGLNDLKYFIQGSVKGFYDNPQLPKLIRNAGFEWVFLGIENQSDETLKFYKKDNQFSSHSISVVVKALQKENIFVLGGIIFGMPSDTRESILATYEFVKQLRIDMAVLLVLTPFPGTALREELIKKNYVTNLYDYSKYDLYHVNVRTDTLSAAELFELFDSLVQKYFIDTGALYRVVKRYPVFFLKSLVTFIVHHPDMVFHHLTKGYFLNSEKRKSLIRSEFAKEY